MTNQKLTKLDAIGRLLMAVGMAMIGSVVVIVMLVIIVGVLIAASH